jgi:transcription-repair coupling factor (superfamily II helicase)
MDQVDKGLEESKAQSLDELSRRVAGRVTAVRLTGVRGASRAAVAAELLRVHAGRPALVLAPSSKATDGLLSDLRTALGQEGAGRVRPFPRPDTLPYDQFSPQPFLVAQRAAVLHAWLECSRSASEPAPVVVAPWTALALRVPARRALRSRTVRLEVGGTTDRDALVTRLIGAGYVRMSLVEERGELAVRGGILDLFPPQAAAPVRAEFLGDEIESLREFDPVSQRSQARLERVAAPPPRELLFEREEVIERADAIREHTRAQGLPEQAADQLIDALLRGHAPPGAESLAPLLLGELETVFDYLPASTLVLIDEPDAGRDRLRGYAEEALAGYAAARDGGRLASPPDALLLSGEEVEAEVEGRRPVSLERLDVADAESGAVRIPVEAASHDELRHELARSRTRDHALEPLVDRLAGWVAEGWRSVLVAPALSGAERLRHLLSEYGVEARLAQDARPIWRWSAPGRIEVRVAALSGGFSLPGERLAVVSEEEIFGPREKRRRRASWQEGAALEGIAQLAAGDCVVHDEHGIGIYRGLVELRAGVLGHVASECLAIEYAGGDRFFLPVQRLNHVQRYAGADGVSPRIDRLGGQTWERAKRKVRRSLRDMARELLALHAARELAPGLSFSPRDAYFEEFEAAFPFEETPDQRDAIEDVLADMQRPKPMDRLVCGDVGYGKTEIAIRATFRAVMDGKQVAVLVPTTVLCQQHLETFRKRFDGYPIRVESLSRFRSPKEARAVLEGLTSGAVDVVVGTHRLLQGRVAFRDLGLLVVDEEHRFGVAHKERIKQLRRSVDVLTLTATPIPRTLQMAFTGIRDLSVIRTPPADRLAVRTQTCRYSESLIREAILREVRRGGQVFFVHNRVRSIGGVAEMLARVVPEARVLVAHGQMRERELEDRMLAFLRGEADVLLCTTIIESGLDIPRANTIVINRAHTLGLAELYQLRGRVGRSHHRAYAYLLVPEPDGMSPDAQRRLEAIQDLSELGSGFRLANMDLEIRGAGDLLGSQQSGHLAAVGYETYMQMLEETVDELRGKIREIEIDPEVRLPIPARLPEDYVPEVGQRLVLYRRLAGARDDGEVDRIRDELLDRYGPLPDDADNLLRVIRIKVLARRLGVTAVDVAGRELVLAVSGTGRIDAGRLVGLVSDPASGIRVTPDHRIFAPVPREGGAEVADAARNLLLRLGA